MSYDILSLRVVPFNLTSGEATGYFGLLFLKQYILATQKRPMSRESEPPVPSGTDAARKNYAVLHQ